MDLKRFCESKTCKGILIGLAGVIVLLVTFQAGLFVGERRAGFSYKWGDAYERTFGDRHGFPMMGTMPHQFMNPHGAVGRIVSISLPTFVLADQDGTEKVVVVKDATSIRQLRDTLTSADLKVGDWVTVFGEPDAQAELDATLIRVLPPPSTTTPAPAPAPTTASGSNL